MPPLRARFAPSPTGLLHVGSARTALLNWLFVHSPSAEGRGRLLLRIDDTDSERSDPELERRIFDDLEFLGLTWDDGPVRQSDRSERYAEVLRELPTELRDGAHVFGDRVIARADGTALYNLASAVDDVDDAITHVLRGRDHVANTELQRSIIVAMGAEPPQYVHAPLLVFEGGAKVSKRTEDSEGPATIAALREAGYPAEAICNALALSLVDYGTDELALTLEDLAARFDLQRLHTADSQFDVDKLRWVSGQHIRAMDDSRFAGELASRGATGLTPPVISAARTGGVTFSECAEVAKALVDPPDADAEAAELIATPEAATALDILDGLVDEWPVPEERSEEVFGELKAEIKQQGLKLGPALHGLRATLTGRAQGVEFPLILATLTAERISEAKSRIH